MTIIHKFICGVTGAGKTYYARRMFEQSDRRCIFVNTTEDLEVNRSADFVSSDQKECLKALQEGKRKVVWLPKTNRDIRLMKDYLFRVGLKINTDEIYHVFDVYVDESHDGWIGLQDMATRGRRHGVRLISISQRPALTDHTILTQSNEHIIFALGDYEKLYFERYNIPYAEHKDYLSPRVEGEELHYPYTYIKFRGGQAERYEPVS